MESNSDPTDEIRVEQLELWARVGVTESERATSQRLTVTITVWPVEPFENLHDDISKATDYAAMCATVKDFVSPRSDRLIETLAAALAERLLGAFAIAKVRLELRKFVLPDAKHVSVIVTRMAED